MKLRPAIGKVRSDFDGRRPTRKYGLGDDVCHSDGHLQGLLNVEGHRGCDLVAAVDSLQGQDLRIKRFKL